MSKKFLVRYVVALCVTASLALAGCGEEGDDPSPGTDSGVVPTVDAGGDSGAGGDAGTVSCDGLTYASYAKALIDKRCAGLCHGAVPAGNSVKLDTLPNVKTHRQAIIDHAVEPRKVPVMPQNLPALPGADQVKLKKWLECGAP